jgi:hypothetical protein
MREYRRHRRIPSELRRSFLSPSGGDLPSPQVKALAFQILPKKFFWGGLGRGTPNTGDVLSLQVRGHYAASLG